MKLDTIQSMQVHDSGSEPIEKTQSRSRRIVAILLFILAAAGCVRLLTDGIRQYLTAGFPSTTGTMTRYVWEDAGDAGRTLKVGYHYVVGSQVLHGDRIRYLFRPFRIGLGDATARAMTWGAGKQVAIFYNPQKPEESLLDKGLTTGDWLFLAIVLAMAIACVGGVCHHARRPTSALRRPPGVGQNYAD